MIMYRTRNKKELTRWSWGFYRIDAGSKKTAIKRMKKWAEKARSNDPDCIHPQMLLVRLIGGLNVSSDTLQIEDMDDSGMQALSLVLVTEQ